MGKKEKYKCWFSLEKRRNVVGIGEWIGIILSCYEVASVFKDIKHIKNE